MSGFVLENHSTYCNLEFTDALSEMTWEQTENATRRAIELILESNVSNVIVSAPTLTRFPDGLLGCLLRIWKSLNQKTRQFIFVTPSENVKEELHAAGLLRYWRVMPSRDAALQFLRLEDTSEFDVAEFNVSEPIGVLAPESQIVAGNSGEPFLFEESKRYCAILCRSDLAKLSWEDLEAAVTGAISRFSLSASPNLMIDLSNVRYINSGVVAGLVRLWKSAEKKGGQFSVVSPNDEVTLILNTSGLSKVWSITDDREEAAYALGVSTTAIVERRESNLLSAVSVPGCIVAALALIPMFLKRESVWGVNSQLTALLLSSAALATGLIAVIREEGLRRKLSVVSVIVSLLVLSTLWFRENPISFRKQFPDYKFQQENDDPTPQ